MRISTITKLRISTKCALVAIITLLVRAAFNCSSLVHRNGALICLTLGITGILLWLKGMAAVIPKPRDEKAASLAEAAAFKHPLDFLKTMKSWGMVIMVSGGTLAPFIAGYDPGPKITVRAKPVTAATNTPPAVAFPELTLQGITVSGKRSSALINGQVLLIGEGIGKARVVGIEATGVTMELEGQTNVLHLKE